MDGRAAPSEQRRARLAGVRWTALFFIVPLGILVAYSFGQIDIITFKVQWGWTLDSYSRVFESLYVNAIGRSLLLSAMRR